MVEERKFAILFAATILSARKLMDMDPNKPNMAKGYFLDRAIDNAAFILERIGLKWPAAKTAASGGARSLFGIRNTDRHSPHRSRSPDASFPF